ncbi:hypothetical protein L209DRAFT_117574 [Thermothelomyces heterothallicus CBS 203.75]
MQALAKGLDSLDLHRPHRATRPNDTPIFPQRIRSCAAEYWAMCMRWCSYCSSVARQSRCATWVDNVGRLARHRRRHRPRWDQQGGFRLMRLSEGVRHSAPTTELVYWRCSGQAPSSIEEKKTKGRGCLRCGAGQTWLFFVNLDHHRWRGSGPPASPT